MHHPRQGKANRDHEEGNEPIRDEFGEDEFPFLHGGHIDLLDRAGFFLAHNVECGQVAGDKHHDQCEERRDHEELKVQLLVEKEECGGFVAQGGGRRLHVGRDDLRQIVRTQRTFGAVDGVGRNEHLGRLAERKLPPELRRDHHDNVGRRLLDVLERGGIGGLLAVEYEVAVGRNLVHKALRSRASVVVHYVDHHVFHLHVHHPRHDAHHHDGEKQNQPRDERVATDLNELFSEQMLQCHGGLG